MVSHALLQSPTRRRAEAFARLLDGGPAEPRLAGLGVLAAALRDVPLPRVATPDPDFRERLRERVVAAAGAQADRSAGLRPGDREPGAEPRPRLRIRARTISLATVAGLTLGTGGVGVASASALPGDTLYGVKRATESLRLAIAGSDLDRGRLTLGFSAVRLGEVEQLVGQVSGGGHPGADLSPETRRLVRTVLEDFDRSTREGAHTLLDVHESSGANAPLTALDDFARQQRPRLAALLSALPDDLRADAARSLALVDRLLVQAERLLEPDAASPPSARASHCRPQGCDVTPGPGGTTPPSGTGAYSPARAGAVDGSLPGESTSRPRLPGVDLDAPDESQADQGIGGVVDDLLGGSAQTHGPALPTSAPTPPAVEVPTLPAPSVPDPTNAVGDATSAANDASKTAEDSVGDLTGDTLP